MRIAREHVDSLDVIAIYLPLQNFPFRVIEITLLNETMSFYHNKLLKLGIVPVLPLSNTRLGDIDAHLSTAQCMNQLRKRTTFIHIHFKRERHLLLRQIAQISRVQFLGKTILWYLRDHQCLWLLCKALQEFYNLTQCDLMGNRAITIPILHITLIICVICPIRVICGCWKHLQTLKFTAMCFTLQ